MIEDFNKACNDFIDERFGDGHISYIHRDYLDGARGFAKYLQSLASEVKTDG